MNGYQTKTQQLEKIIRNSGKDQTRTKTGESGRLARNGTDKGRCVEE